jgi:hypothetical protein
VGHKRPSVWFYAAPKSILPFPKRNVNPFLLFIKALEFINYMSYKSDDHTEIHYWTSWHFIFSRLLASVLQP